jgi:hypothetical protein
MFVTILAAVALTPQRAHHQTRSHRHKHVVAKVVDETPGIKAGYMDVEKAFETKNWTLFRSRCTSNFKEEMPNHQVLDLNQAVAGLRKQFGPLSDLDVHYNLQQQKVTGSMAEIEGRVWGKAKLNGKSVRLDGSETDYLKKVRGRWMAYYVKIHDQSMSVNGHVVMHMP